ncbi:hypothetical protein GCM10022243_32390 [Saccharothrix violaceirubra]
MVGAVAAPLIASSGPRQAIVAVFPPRGRSVWEIAAIGLSLAGALMAVENRFAGSPLADAWCWLVLVGAWLAWSDWVRQRIPTFGTVALAVVGLALLARSGDDQALIRAVVAATVVLIAAIAVATVASLGGGDVKLLAAVSAYTGWWGWSHVLTAVIGALVLAAVTGVVLLILGRITPGTHIAVGPAIIGGALSSVPAL